MYRQAYIFLCLTTLFWGGNAVASRLAVGHVSPMMLTTLRWILSSSLLVFFAWPHLKRDWPAIRAKLPLLAFLGMMGFTGFNALFYSSAQFTSAINIAIEQGAIPMVIFVVNFLLFRLRVTALQVAGFMLSLVGVAIVASHGEFARLLDLDVNFGDALMLVAVLLYAAYTVGLRLKPDIHWLSLMFVLSLFALLASFPLVAWEAATDRLIVPDAQGWMVVGYVVVFPSLLAQSLYIRGNELIGGNRAGLFINLVPIFGTLLSIVILGEDFFAYHAVALTLVLGGIWLAEHSGRKNAGA
ncbi:DMT family transporter [Nitratireductor aquimarinus]|uniref:DMT family transporter n=1 Tax=Nitratireductor aquimarinus TaxID=889300 RepID=A0ABU4AHS9_9HYPH|nr:MULTISPECIES: DMT family transporter [Alphaproteobacteria]MBY6021816.1 DMT family transporter [Nitratireductor sp. DP7N14-4]MBN7757029.1 DMT family transporter [Nitratireductor aquimarinus]MBN7760971.1 DMT family transporter [Nitratireductor aquibiodomus]MBY5999789.1 DMT family transporter [Tritonibacter mobilis]MCV0352595.1 DMT family transporter [Nitratireductor sp.]